MRWGPQADKVGVHKQKRGHKQMRWGHKQMSWGHKHTGNYKDINLFVLTVTIQNLLNLFVYKVLLYIV